MPIHRSPLWERSDLADDQLVTEFQKECQVVRKSIDGDLVKVQLYKRYTSKLRDEGTVKFCFLTCSKHTYWSFVLALSCPAAPVATWRACKHIWPQVAYLLFWSVKT